MIFCREFSSIHEIDSEFIPSLEELLASTMPDINILKKEEEEKSDREYFIYHLFFGQRTNGPIGFAKAVVHIDKEVKPTFFNKIMKKAGLEKSVEWNIFKDHYSGFVFNPKYEKHLKEAALKAVEKLYKGNEVLKQKLFFDDFYENTFQGQGSNQIEKAIMPDALVKKQQNYQGFIASLSSETQKYIRSIWRHVYQDPELKLGEYNNFKDVFTYKDTGAEQYKELKKHHFFSKYQNMECDKQYLTIENDYEVLAIVIYTHGKQGNVFFEIVHGKENFDLALLIQLAIMKFYEDPRASYLHALHTNINNELYQFGFMKKSQLSILTSLIHDDSRKIH